MAILDIILLVCFIPAIVSGISKGLVKQIVDITSIVVGAWAAFRFSQIVSGWLSGFEFMTMDPKLLYVISFAIIVVVAVLLLNLLGRLICKVISIASLGWVNKLLGCVLGIAKTALILGLAIMVFEGLNNKFGMVSRGKLDDAVVYNTLKDMIQVVFPKIKALICQG